MASGAVRVNQSTPVYTQFTAPLNPNPRAGTYTFQPVDMATYYRPYGAGSQSGWRSGVYAGPFNSGEYGVAEWFYGEPGHGALMDTFPNGVAGVTVSRLQIYVSRSSGYGASSAQVCHWRLHNFASRPGVSVNGAGYLTTTTDSGILAWGSTGWIDLPTAWVGLMVNATTIGGTAWPNGFYRGIALGNDSSSQGYIAMPPLLNLFPNPVGTLKVTIT